MISYQSIRDVHLEPSTICNARCPLCVRNANGYPKNFGYPEIHMTLENLKKIFPEDFISQLDSLTVCGNFGDFVANPEALELITWFRNCNKRLQISISTNAGARNEKFWKSLAKLNVIVYFCIDGLSDTHSIYRIDTKWETVIDNARSFISENGTAVWKMIVFDHNKHQVDECKKLANDLGFSQFDLVDHSRSNGSVFDRQGNLVYKIGSGQTHENITQVLQWMDPPLENDGMLARPEKTKLNCYSENQKSIYVAANGEVYPCCYLGFYPKTFRNSHWTDQSNRQLVECMENLEINAAAVGIENALRWFENIRKKWSIPKYQDGRLRMCDEHCGSDKYLVVDQEMFAQKT